MNKLGFYPTPPSQFPYIMARLAPKSDQGVFRLIDPCCGKGVFLRQIQDQLATLTKDHQKVESYGIELDIDRATEASRVLNHTANCSYDHARIKPLRSMSFLWLNPPYDNDSTVFESARAEVNFMRHTLNFLQPGGVFAFCIPQEQYTKTLAHSVAARCHNVRVYRFTDDEFGRFQQTVLFAYRGRKSTAEEREIENYLIAVGNGEEELSALDDFVDLVWEIPTSKTSGLSFRSAVTDPFELAKDIATSPLIEHVEAQITEPIRELEGKRPILPMRVTHLAQLISAGGKNTTVGVPVLTLTKGSKALTHMAGSDLTHYLPIQEALNSGEKEEVTLILDSRSEGYAEIFTDEWGNEVPDSYVTDNRHYIAGGTIKVTDVEKEEDEEGKEVIIKTQRLVSIGHAFLPDGTVLSLK